MQQTPSIGRIVHYMLTNAQALAINEERKASVGDKRGTLCLAGDVFPMIITRVHQFMPQGINGQVFLDGDDSWMITHATEGTGPGQWHWPQAVHAQAQRSTDHILTEKELAERPDKHLEDDKRMERGDE